jgi:hypothetical protein
MNDANQPPSLAGRAAVVAAVVGAALGVAQPAHSTPPLYVAFPVDVTYEIEDLTELCGVEVWFRMEGTFKGILFRDKSGVITGEFDSQPNTWATLYSPETGGSFRNPFATTFHNEYPHGVEPGDRVVASATGFLEKVPGLSARAGRLVFPDGEVLFVEDGVPYVDYGEPSQEPLAKYTFDEADAAVCDRMRGD